MPDNIPETGDVVIHSSESHATTSYALYAVPGPDQFACATRGEAERMARSYAKRSGVNLWFSEGPSGFTLLARFRAARGQRRRTPSSDAAMSVLPNRLSNRNRLRNTMIERTRIEAVLDRVRPLLQADGANIELVDVGSDGVTVRLVGLGRCKTAPLSIHMGLSDVLREEIPDFGELRLV